jgi:hypothetical protein
MAPPVQRALKENPPQFALWAEREDGSFAGTIFATRKVATGHWAFAGGNTRKRRSPSGKPARPAKTWTRSRGLPLAATYPSRSRAARERPSVVFYLWAEFNHSTDWNDAYPKNAEEGEPGYSGGEGGSGQPSLLYRAFIDLDSGADRFDFQVVGHGSPDGSDGEVVADLSTLTSALGIVESIVAEVKR